MHRRNKTEEKMHFEGTGTPQASRSNPTIGGFSVQTNRASCVSVRQKLFCPTETAPFREVQRHCSEVAIPEEKKYKSQNQTDGEDNTNNLNLKYPPKRPSQVYFETAPLLLVLYCSASRRLDFFCCIIVVNPSAAMFLATSLAVLLTRSMP